MAQVQQHVLSLHLLLAAALPVFCAERFFPDDPVWKLPPPKSLRAAPAKTPFHPELKQPVRVIGPRPSVALGAINTLGEVPDSTWFTNRSRAGRLTIEQLVRGSGDGQPPVPPFQVVTVRLESPPAFIVRDARGRHFTARPNPNNFPELATAAGLIANRFLHAAGYNVPDAYILSLHRDELHPGADATVAAIGHRRRRMTEKDLDLVLERIAHQREDGSFRMLARLDPPGQPVDTFHYNGVRPDDPNDIVPHEDRRELRGLFVLAAWLNYTETGSANTLDVMVNEGGRQFLRHYLTDLTASLGSDADMPKDARLGYESMVPATRRTIGNILSFGLHTAPWERAAHPNNASLGRFESAAFNPEDWQPAFPNHAFLRRNPEDEYWAAKLVCSFTDEEIRAVVDAAHYTDPKIRDYVARTLTERRDKIGRIFLNKVLALDNFRIRNGELYFDDLAIQRGFAASRTYDVEWARFDNATNQSTVLTNRTGLKIPTGQPYVWVRLNAKGDARHTVTVYIRNASEVVGIDRTW